MSAVKKLEQQCLTLSHEVDALRAEQSRNRATVAICLIAGAIDLLEAAERDGPRGKDALPGVINPVVKALHKIRTDLVYVREQPRMGEGGNTP